MRKYFYPLAAFALIAVAAAFNIYCLSFPSSERYRPKLFNRSVAEQTENSPFYYYSLPAYQVSSNEKLLKAGETENVNEWLAYLGNRVTETQMREVIYEFYAYSIDRWLKKEITLTELLAEGDLGKINKINPSAVEYILFAKEIETVLEKLGGSYQGYSWNEQAQTPEQIAQKETEDADKQKRRLVLLETAKARYGKAKDNFLKLRYGYQAVVLTRYSAKNLKDCSTAYDKYIAPVAQKSVIRYWAMLHKATGLAEQSRRPEADFYYAQVFENCYNKRYRAFQLYNHSSLDSSLLFAKTDAERAAVWSLSAYNDGKNLDEFKKIYQYAPNSKSLNLLIANEISKLEDWVLTKEMTNFGYEEYDETTEKNIPEKKITEKNLTYLRQVRDWVEKVIADKKVNNPAMWQLAAAHLYYMDKKYDKANALLDAAEKADGNNAEIRKQISTTRLLSFALDNRAITPSVENKVYKELKNIFRSEVAEARKAYEYQGESEYERDKRSKLDNLCIALASRYEQVGDRVKAALLLSKCNELTRNSQKFIGWYGIYHDYFFYLDEFATSKDMENLVALINKESKTGYEYFLTEKADKEYQRLMDLQGTILLREEKEEEALKVWTAIPKDYWTNGTFAYPRYLNEDPFEIPTMRNKGTKEQFYSKPATLSKILEYKRLAEQQPEKKAYYYYLLGNVYYNISYYGTAWLTSHWGWSSYENMAKHVENRRPDDENYYQLKKSMSYYQAAADASKDKGFSALCLRLLAHEDGLREQQVYEAAQPEGYFPSEGQPEHLYKSHYAERLKVDFVEFQDVLKDCGQFHKLVKP